jgi:hypothetical protein
MIKEETSSIQQRMLIQNMISASNTTNINRKIKDEKKRPKKKLPSSNPAFPS